VRQDLVDHRGLPDERHNPHRAGALRARVRVDLEDPQSRDHIWTYVERMVEQEKITVVLTTHYMEEADRLCSRLAIVDRGRVVALDTPANLKRILGGDVVLLTVREPKIDAVKALGGIDKIERRDGVVQLTVHDAKQRLPGIMQTIGAVESVEVRPATLDDVFMHYTGREMRDTAGEGGWVERSMRYRSATR
jgi:ABC-2 type transport system ATP-binding protein